MAGGQAAFQAAQLEMSQTKLWSSPYYWAGFVLQLPAHLPNVEPLKGDSGPHLATLILPLTGSRSGGEQNSFKINQDVQTVQLVAHIRNSDYRSFDGELQNADGKQLFTFRRLKARKTANGNALLLSVTAKLFKGSDFVLQVSGVTGDGHLEDAGFYSFRITRN